MAVNNLNEKRNQCSSITCPRCTCNPHLKPVNKNVARKHVKWNHGHLNPHNQLAVPHSYQKNIDRVPPRVQQKSRDIRYHINLGQFRRATFNAKKLKYTLSVKHSKSNGNEHNSYQQHRAVQEHATFMQVFSAEGLADYRLKCCIHANHQTPSGKIVYHVTQANSC